MRDFIGCVLVLVFLFVASHGVFSFMCVVWPDEASVIERHINWMLTDGAACFVLLPIIGALAPDDVTPTKEGQE